MRRWCCLSFYILYRAPLWNEAFVASKSAQMIVNRVMRTLAIRVIAGYRTVSLEAALLLARIPPAYLIANMRRRIYDRIKDLRNNNRWSKKNENELKAAENMLMRRQWEMHLENPNLAGVRTREAILPHFQEWMDRRHGSILFRITQLMTGHGCFGTYLHRIGKAATPYCDHCDAIEIEDSTEHTLKDCEAWTDDRNTLGETLELDNVSMTLGSIVQQILVSEEKWAAFSRFANEVILKKEIAERIRQEEEARRANNNIDNDSVSVSAGSEDS